MSVLTVVLTAMLAVSGCARESGSGESAGAPVPGSSSAVPRSTELPVTDLPVPSGPAAGSGGTQTISGTVSAGVEPNCFLLSSGGTEYLLIFDSPAVRQKAVIGGKVTVTGRSAPGQMSTCQQGVPFIVSAVRPN